MDKGQILAERVKRLRDLALAKDGKSSELYKNAMRMVMTYDPAYKYLAVIDGATGIGKVGNQFFQRIPASEELTVAQTQVFNTWSQDKRQLFVLRHEVEHMSAANLKLFSLYKYSSSPNTSRYQQAFEIDASTKAFNWIVSL
jgi:hypothetical protein